MQNLSIAQSLHGAPNKLCPFDSPWKIVNWTGELNTIAPWTGLIFKIYNQNCLNLILQFCKFLFSVSRAINEN